MGYFSNGTEGRMYEDAFCSRCVHYDHEPGVDPPCPIWMAHMLFAYEETGSGSNAETILDMLIPRSADGLNNEQCTGFVAAPQSPVAQKGQT